MIPTSPDDVAVLECRGVVKRYGPLVAVNAVDLSVTAGEVVGLVGKNGAGKSSLIKVLTGAVQPDAGRLLMSGEEVTLRGPGDSRARGVGFVHQELNLIDQATIAENIALGGGYPRLPVGLVNWRGLHARAEELMDAVDIGHVHPRTPVSALTAVQRRQVMIASALWHPPKVLILDEPTASLSEHEVVILHGIVRRLQERGTAILYVSHRLDEVIGITDRVLVMRDGAVVEEERTGALDKPRLVSMITGGAVPTEPPVRAAGDSGDVALKIDSVTSDTSPRPASFEVRAGEILGLAGLVGSGRSELLRAIYGADARRSGEVSVFGKVVPDRPNASLRAGLAFLSEDRLHAGLVTGFSIAKNITFANMRKFRVRPWLPIPSRTSEHREAHSKVADLSVKAGSVDQPVVSLSGGNQQKVLMARWLATEPRVLLLDEPTLGIDVEAKAEIYDLLRRLAASGFALVVVSSEFPELEMLCTRSLVMREGMIVAELEGDRVTESNLLHYCFDTLVEA